MTAADVIDRVNRHAGTAQALTPEQFRNWLAMVGIPVDDAELMVAEHSHKLKREKTRAN